MLFISANISKHHLEGPDKSFLGRISVLVSLWHLLV